MSDKIETGPSPRYAARFHSFVLVLMLVLMLVLVLVSCC